MNALTRLLARRIVTTGPMTLADYMANALGHPEYGYYTTRDPFGRSGDFITAPEISQIFGELVGLWSVSVWEKMGSPARFNLVEFGPGRGTLMADAMRAAAQVPAFLKSANLVLIESSPVLRNIQAERLSAYDPTWCRSLEAVPDGPILAVANEFFDALPAHQFIRMAGGWRERLVGWDETGLRFILSAGTTPYAALLPPEVRFASIEGDIAEVQPMGLTIIAGLAQRITVDSGAALIIDYGHSESAPGDTLRAVHAHEPQDIFEAPGEIDLSVHVDFAALRRAVNSDVSVWGPIGQGEFLKRLGIAIRAEVLGKTATPKQSMNITSGVERLIAPDQMGSLFKVLCLTKAGLLQPPGFEE